jgi:hypothetical protein
MQRFKESLVTGVWNDNPGRLVRDDNGGYVKYDDAIKLAKWCINMANTHGGSEYCRARSEALMMFPELKDS